MARKLIHYNPDEAGQLRCDAPGCDFIEPGPMPFTRDLIGRPCPKCGASLLSERDYRDTLRQFAAIDFINRYFGWLGSEKLPEGARSLAIRTHDGEVTAVLRKPGQ